MEVDVWQAQRNELVRKLEVAKVQAKKEELRLQVRNLTRNSSAGAHHNMPRNGSGEALEHRGAGGVVLSVYANICLCGACVCVCTYVFVCVCVCIYAYVCIHI